MAPGPSAHPLVQAWFALLVGYAAACDGHPRPNDSIEGNAGSIRHGGQGAGESGDGAAASGTTQESGGNSQRGDSESAGASGLAGAGSAGAGGTRGAQAGEAPLGGEAGSAGADGAGERFDEPTDVESPLDVPLRAAAPEAELTGFVRSLNGDLLAGAQIDVGDVSASSLATGAYALTAVVGHQLLSVQAAGYVPFLAPVGVVSAMTPLDVVLVPNASASSVNADGGVVRAGEAELVFPASAVPNGTLVSATLLTDVRTLPGELGAFIDDEPYLLRSVLHVDASAQPSSPVTVTLPVDDDATVDSIRLAGLEPDGTWGTPIAPGNVSDGFATFSVTHFSDYGALEKNEGWRVRAVEGATYRGTDLVPGQVLPPVFSLQCKSKCRVLLESADSAVTLVSGGEGQFDGSPGTIYRNVLTITCDTGCPSAGLQFTVPPPRLGAPARKPLMFRSRGAIGGVRGTVGRATIFPCSSQADIALSVAAGTVLLTQAGTGLQVPAGSEANLCDGCQAPKDAACCWGQSSAGVGGGRACATGAAPDCELGWGGIERDWVCSDGSWETVACGPVLDACACRLSRSEEGAVASCDYPQSCGPTSAIHLACRPPGSDVSSLPTSASYGRPIPCADDADCPRGAPVCRASYCRHR